MGERGQARQQYKKIAVPAKAGTHFDGPRCLRHPMGRAVRTAEWFAGTVPYC